MKTLTKSLVGTVAAGAMAMTAAATPAQARDRDGGIGAGEIIAGALIIGGIAAAAGAFRSNERDYYHVDDRRGYRGDNPRAAVERCVRAAEGAATRYSYGGRAQVTDIRDVDRKRDGFRIKGRIAVNQNARHWRSSDSRYGRGWDNDYRGYDDRLRGYDSGRFTCEIRHGRITKLDFSGIRGL